MKTEEQLDKERDRLVEIAKHFPMTVQEVFKTTSMSGDFFTAMNDQYGRKQVLVRHVCLAVDWAAALLEDADLLVRQERERKS